MQKVFLIHGFQGAPNGGWRPWLMRKLADVDIYACALPMPNAFNPQKNEWVKMISDVVGGGSEGQYIFSWALFRCASNFELYAKFK